LLPETEQTLEEELLTLTEETLYPDGTLMKEDGENLFPGETEAAFLFKSGAVGWVVGVETVSFFWKVISGFGAEK
jgi:hypothetical protein